MTPERTRAFCVNTGDAIETQYGWKVVTYVEYTSANGGLFLSLNDGTKMYMHRHRLVNVRRESFVSDHRSK